MLFMLTLFAAGCGSSGDSDTILGDTAETTITTAPIDGATDVALNVKITATSNKELTASTVNTATFTLKTGTTAVAGTVAYVDGVMRFSPTDTLIASTLYSATITTGVKETGGTALLEAPKVWSFTTGTTSDILAPTVTSTNPLNAAIDVPINKKVSALFNEALDATTVNTTTFTLATTIGNAPVAGTVSYSSNTMLFTPTANLVASTQYTATITTGVTDLAGNALAAAKVWSFTTGTGAAEGPAPVNLGTAGNFVILTKAGITNVPTSAIVGDIGSSPITGSSMNTVTCAEITGNIYGVDDTYAVDCYKGTADDKTYVDTAVADMGTAYTDAAGRTSPDFTEEHAGDLSGKTLAPGLYKWGTGVSIDATGTTLSGGANDVWIFQIAGDLTVADGAIITLIGALPENIFWQVGGLSGAIIGTTVQFKGVLLAEKAATVNTGSTVDGRLLVQTAVSLNQNTVTQP